MAKKPTKYDVGVPESSIISMPTQSTMKMLSTVIPLDMLSATRERLLTMNVSGLTVTEIQSITLSASSVPRSSVHTLTTRAPCALKLELVVSDRTIPAVVQALETIMATKYIPCLLFVHPIESVTRIRTGETCTGDGFAQTPQTTNHLAAHAAHKQAMNAPRY